jgi:hypothetical protein
MDINIKVSKIDLSKITEAIKESVFGRQQMKEFMQGLANDIKKRTRMGYGVGRDLGPKGKFLPLSKKYKKYRKEKASLSEFTKPTRSNLTLSGQLLDSLIADSSGTLKGEITIKDTRKPIKGQKKTPTNNQLAEWHEEGAGKLPKRPFMHVSIAEYDRLVQAMQKKLNAQLKKTKI